MVQRRVSVSPLKLDGAPVQPEAVGRDGYSILVAVRRNHGVGEGERAVGRVDRRIPGVPGVCPNGDGDVRRPLGGVHRNRVLECHQHRDRVAGGVGSVAARITAQGDARNAAGRERQRQACRLGQPVSRMVGRRVRQGTEVDHGVAGSAGQPAHLCGCAFRLSDSNRDGADPSDEGSIGNYHRQRHVERRSGGHDGLELQTIDLLQGNGQQKRINRVALELQSFQRSFAGKYPVGEVGQLVAVQPQAAQQGQVVKDAGSQFGKLVVAQIQFHQCGRIVEYPDRQFGDLVAVEQDRIQGCQTVKGVSSQFGNLVIGQFQCEDR